MPVPAIEDNEWKRMNAIARFAASSGAGDIESMRFGDKINLLLDVGPVEEYEELDPERYEYSHTYWDTPKKIEAVVEPTTTHRPEVDAETIERLDQWVNEKTWPNASSLSHNDKVALLLEKSEMYYNALECYVEEMTITVKDG